MNLWYKKMKFSIKDLFSKCKQICRFVQNWSHLVTLVIKILHFCAVYLVTYVWTDPSEQGFNKDAILGKESQPISLKMSFAAYYTRQTSISCQFLCLCVNSLEKIPSYSFLNSYTVSFEYRVKKDAVVAEKMLHLTEKSFFYSSIYKVKVNCMPIAFLTFWQFNKIALLFGSFFVEYICQSYPSRGSKQMY